jgi:molybdopterin-guanine dinucleotide biosynthesis protein A
MIPPLADTTLVILAGGLSSRMGYDKAMVQVGGRTLLDDAVARLAPTCAGAVISVHERRDGVPWRQIPDETSERTGALGGIAAVLAAVETEWIFAIAVDMPALGDAAKQAIASFRTDATDAVVPQVRDADRNTLRPEPLAAFYRTRTLNAAREQLATGVYAIRPFLERINTRWIDPSEPGAPLAAAFLNVNTPEDLGRIDT